MSIDLFQALAAMRLGGLDADPLVIDVASPLFFDRGRAKRPKARLVQPPPKLCNADSAAAKGSGAVPPSGKAPSG